MREAASSVCDIFIIHVREQKKKMILPWAPELNFHCWASRKRSRCTALALITVWVALEKVLERVLICGHYVDFPISYFGGCFLHRRKINNLVLHLSGFIKYFKATLIRTSISNNVYKKAQCLLMTGNTNTCWNALSGSKATRRQLKEFFKCQKIKGETKKYK